MEQTQALQPIEYSNQRILTTQQIAEAYGTDERRISENFNRNKERYTPGKHYFFLEGEELQTFVASTQFAYNLIDKFAPKLYLWTEKGALMHAKSLNTDKAWTAYEMLVDEYYRLKDGSLQGLEPLAYLDQVIERQREILRNYRKVKHQERQRLGLVPPCQPRLQKPHEPKSPLPFAEQIIAILKKQMAGTMVNARFVSHQTTALRKAGVPKVRQILEHLLATVSELGIVKEGHGKSATYGLKSFTDGYVS